jgi:hypothetical protein
MSFCDKSKQASCSHLWLYQLICWMKWYCINALLFATRYSCKLHRWTLPRLLVFSFYKMYKLLVSFLITSTMTETKILMSSLCRSRSLLYASHSSVMQSHSWIVWRCSFNIHVSSHVIVIISCVLYRHSACLGLVYFSRSYLV